MHLFFFKNYIKRKLFLNLSSLQVLQRMWGSGWSRASSHSKTVEPSATQKKLINRQSVVTRSFVPLQMATLLLLFILLSVKYFWIKLFSHVGSSVQPRNHMYSALKGKNPHWCPKGQTCCGPCMGLPTGGPNGISVGLLLTTVKLRCPTLGPHGHCWVAVTDSRTSSLLFVSACGI